MVLHRRRSFVPETQLVDGRCPDCGGAVDRVSEESYFFKLSHFEKAFSTYDATPIHHARHPPQ